MENVPSAVKTESIKAFQSAINKTEKAVIKIADKGANATLINKRLKGLYIGLAVLEHAWNNIPFQYTAKELAEACITLTNLLSSLEKMYAKSKPRSPQATLLERRILAFKLAIQAIDT
jgi:hypothetical protein